MGARYDAAAAQGLSSHSKDVPGDRRPQRQRGDRAREKLVTLLTKYGLSWSDVPACIAEADADDARRAPKPTAPPAAAGPGPEVNVLDLILRLIELHFVMTPEEKLVAALWACTATSSIVSIIRRGFSFLVRLVAAAKVFCFSF